MGSIHRPLPDTRGKNDYPGIGHAFVIIEDPATGMYFVADPSKPFPYMGPDPGNVVVERLLELQDNKLSVASGIPWPIDKQRLLIDLNLSDRPMIATTSVLYSASSRFGSGMDRCRAWLKNAPVDFRRFADSVNRRHAKSDPHTGHG